MRLRMIAVCALITLALNRLWSIIIEIDDAFLEPDIKSLSNFENDKPSDHPGFTTKISDNQYSDRGRLFLRQFSGKLASRNRRSIDNKDGRVTEKEAALNNFSDLLAMNMSMSVPKDLRVVVVGDSLTRYQYLSLVYFLKFGRWIDPRARPSLMQNNHYGTWVGFYNASKTVLQPFEQCDCYRNGRSRRYERVFENRFFLEPDRNNAVTYIQKFAAKFPFRSHWRAADAHQTHALITNNDIAERDVLVDTLRWSEFIRDFIARLEPPPKIFIFNQGLWNLTGYDIGPAHPEVQREIIDAIAEAGMISVYKTTTKENGAVESGPATMDDYEQQLCDMADYCYDLSWTWMVPQKYYVDKVHFVEPIYSWFNIQLLELLYSISEDIF